jgi:large subunit ribosomal protein L24
MAAKLRKGDKVVVLAGKDKGKEGTISSVDPKSNKAVVDGINMAIRHTRQSQASQGGRLPKAMPIELSNLSLSMQMESLPELVSKLIKIKKSEWLNLQGM